MTEQQTVIAAIRDSWTAQSSAEPDAWTPVNPAKGQCEVSSFVAWEYLGGDLVLSQVFVDGEMTEHHYWNRVGGQDIDISRDQFAGDETITEIDLVTDETLRTKQSDLAPELAARIEVLRTAVRARIGDPTRAF